MKKTMKKTPSKSKKTGKDLAVKSAKSGTVRGGMPMPPPIITWHPR